MIIYDCEIINAIQVPGEAKIEGIKYCDGWHDFKGMGVAVIGAYDYNTDRYRVYLQDNFPSFELLVRSTDLVIGFNSTAFDNKLCYAHGIDIPLVKSWDALVNIWRGAGLGADFDESVHRDFSLNKCVKANFGLEKNGSGADAPIHWQQGYYGNVIDYCLHDVWLTKKLVDRIFAQGNIVDPRDTSQRIRVSYPRPVWRSK